MVDICKPHKADILNTLTLVEPYRADTKLYPPMSSNELPIRELCTDLESQYLEIPTVERRDSETSDTSQQSNLAGTKRWSRAARPSQSESNDKTKKKIHPKVRTGCDTCKKRKIKCDEGKPFCQRCLKSGRQCEGYHPPQPKMFEPLLKRERSNLSSKEKSHQYYLDECSSWLSRYKSVQLDFRFWRELVPQLAEELAPVRQCLIAASATCEKYNAKYSQREPSDEVRERTVFALEQYTTALQDLRSCISNASISHDATLVCCLLLTFSDAYHIGVPLTFDHVFAGLQLCKLIKKTSPAKSPLATKSEIDGMMLLPAFGYWADCAQIYGGTFTEQRDNLVKEFAEVRGMVIPPYYDDVDEAYSAMDKILRQIVKATIETDDEILNELYQNLTDILEAFQASLALTKHVEGTSANFAFRSLIIHHRTATIMLNTLNNIDETVFDSYTSDFEFLVSETENLMRLRASDETLEIQRDRIWLGVIPPLFFASTKCREAGIRQRAIQAMHSAPHNERLWSTCTAAQVAKELIWLENDNAASAELSQQNPPTLRVNLKEIKFDLAASKIQLLYERQNVKGPRFATSTISWEKDPDIDAFHPPQVFDMPLAMVQMAGYSTLLSGYRGISCHCKGQEKACEHTILLRSTLD